MNRALRIAVKSALAVAPCFDPRRGAREHLLSTPPCTRLKIGELESVCGERFVPR